jgi:hypothetical protein
MHRVTETEEIQNMLHIYVWGYEKQTHQILFLKGREVKGITIL